MNLFSRITSVQWKDVRVYLAGIILFFIIFSIGIFAETRAFVQSQMYATGNGIQILAQFIFRGKGELQNRVEELETQLSALHITTADHEALKRENDELRHAITSIAERPTLFAQSKTFHVIGKSSSTLEHTLRINGGSSEGIEKDDIVTSGEGYLIGVVDSVSEYAATVRLIQDSRSSIPAKVLSTRGTEGLVEGQSGFAMRLSFVPTDADLREDLIVVTSGVGGRYPPDLVIGHVTVIHENENAAFKEVLVAPFIDARNITTVLVL